jgi:hypothetical protein
MTYSLNLYPEFPRSLWDIIVAMKLAEPKWHTRLYTKASLWNGTRPKREWFCKQQSYAIAIDETRGRSIVNLPSNSMMLDSVWLLLTSLTSFSESLFQPCHRKRSPGSAIKQAHLSDTACRGTRILSKAVLTGRYNLHILLTARYRHQLCAACPDVKTFGCLDFAVFKNSTPWGRHEHLFNKHMGPADR